MSRIENEFVVGERPRIVVAVSSADVIVTGGAASVVDVVIDGREGELEAFDVAQTGNVVSIRSRATSGRWFRRGVTVRLTVPTGSALDVRTASGDVRIAAPVSEAEIRTSSGDIDLSSCSGKVRIKTASGDIAIGDVAGGARIASASGDVRIDRSEGDLSIHTASGDVSVGDTSGSIETHAASGDIEITRFSGAFFDGVSMSGDFDIGLAVGMKIDADIRTRSGRLRNLVEPSGVESTITAALSIKTMSGDVTLR